MLCTRVQKFNKNKSFKDCVKIHFHNTHEQLQILDNASKKKIVSIFYCIVSLKSAASFFISMEKIIKLLF